MSIINIENLGTLTYNYKIDVNKKYNVISACLFKAYDVSDFSRYTGNLLKFKNLEAIKNKEYVFRLYYDDSILQDNYIKKIWSQLNKYYQLVKYDCPNFKNLDGRHNGFFGSLLRYLPFHNFENNDVNWCFVTDVDGDIKRIEQKFLYYNKITKKYNLQCMYFYRFCAFSTHVININNAMLGGIILMTIKLPINIFISYITDFVDKIFNVYPLLKRKINIETKQKYHHKFFYGVDEIYLELNVVSYLKIHKIHYGQEIRYSFSYNLYKLLKKFFADININDENYNKIILSINKKFNTNYNTLNDFLDFFKNYDYKRETNMYKQYEYFHKKVIKLYNKKKNLTKFPEFDCFIRINKFIDDTNNIQIFN